MNQYTDIIPNFPNQQDWTLATVLRTHAAQTPDAPCLLAPEEELELTYAQALDTAERILAAAGHRLAAEPVLSWQDVEIGGGRTAAVPDRLPGLPVREAVRHFEMPLHLDWSRPGRSVDLSDRRQRARAYEVVLREGRPIDIESIVDGALLVDLWDDLVLPRRVRTVWQPLIDQVVGRDG
mgnify:CR=1 FL=1